MSYIVNNFSKINFSLISLLANSEPSVDVNFNVELPDLPHVEHGEPIIDKKSVFQAHLARITSEKEI